MQQLNAVEIGAVSGGALLRDAGEALGAAQGALDAGFADGKALGKEGIHIASEAFQHLLDNPLVKHLIADALDFKRKVVSDVVGDLLIGGAPQGKRKSV